MWFYFRQSPAHLTTKEELRQREEVLDFRGKFRTNGLFRDYRTPAEFKDELRRHLTLWLNQCKAKAPKSRSSVTKPDAALATKAKARSSAVSDRKKAASAIVAEEITAKTTSAKSSAPSRKTPATRSSNTQNSRAVGNPGNWVLLNRSFFQTRSSNTKSDGSIVLQISPKSLEQVAELKALQTKDFHSRELVSYSDLHQAGTML